MAELSDIKPAERSIEITHPKKHHKIGLRIHLMSIDDDRMKAIKRQITDANTYLEARGRVITTDVAEKNTNELAFKAITGWEWHTDESDGTPATFHGEQPDFDKKAVFAVFSELPFVRSQITKEVSASEDFFE